MSPSDRIAMLRAMGVHLELTADGKNVHASGTPIILEAAMPTLRIYGGEVAAHLWATFGDASALGVWEGASLSRADVRVLNVYDDLSEDETSAAVG